MNKQEMESEILKLEALCRELLDGANKCSEAPHYIVQPFMGIVKRHSEIINRRKLL